MKSLSDDDVVVYDLFDPDVLKDPYPYYRKLRNDCPVYYNADRDFWTLSRFDDIQEAARDWKSLSSAHGVELDDTQTFYPQTFGPGNVVIADPPDHRRIRRLVQPHFTQQAIGALEHEIRLIVGRLLDRLHSSIQPDLARDFAWRVPVATVGHILGFPREDHDLLADLLFAFETREPDAGQDDYFTIPAVARKAGETLARYIAGQLEFRRKHPTADLLSILVRAEMQRDLARDEARGLTFILLMAGVDTTVCLVSNALDRMQPLSDNRGGVASDSSFASRAVEELVRFEAPVQGEARVALTDVVVRDITIPAGSRVWLCFGSANRDEQRFDHPDDLDFGRTPKRHLGFGEGIHHCIGAPLARLEGRVALEEFFRRFPAYELGDGSRLNQHTTRGWTCLPAELG